MSMWHRILLRSIPFLLAFYFSMMLGLALLWQADFEYYLVVMAVLLACCLGLIFRRPWAISGLGWAGIIGIVSGIVEIFREGEFDLLILTFILGSGLAACLFWLKSLRALFMDGSLWISRKSILLVDDDRGLLRLLKANLRKEGYFILTAETGEKGLVLARRYVPDLILLDVILPKLKGRAVCAQLKSDPKTKKIPVIFLTAKDSPDDVQAEMAAGAVAHITKPIDYRNLSSEIKKHLPE